MNKKRNKKEKLCRAKIGFGGENDRKKFKLKATPLPFLFCREMSQIEKRRSDKHTSVRKTEKVMSV